MDSHKVFSSNKGQVATEYLALVGVCLIIIAALTSYAFVQFGDSTSINQTNEAMKELQETANKVYSLGDGSSVIATISLPNNISSFSASGRALIMWTSSSGTPSENLVEFDFNVAGSLPTSQGNYTIAVSNNNGTVDFNAI